VTDRLSSGPAAVFRRNSGMIRFASVIMIASATIFGGLLCADADAQTVAVEQYQHPKGEKDLNFNKPYLEGIKDGLIDLQHVSRRQIILLGRNASSPDF
jgi:hypothetical protein